MRTAVFLLHALVLGGFVLSATGLSSFAQRDGGDCCEERGIEADCPGSDDGGCPPLCDACPCRGYTATPAAAVALLNVSPPQPLHHEFGLGSLPADPPMRGVFHPPRARV